MANKISQATWDTIGRYVLRKSGGITELVNGVCHSSYARYPNLADACYNYVQNGNLDVYYDDWKAMVQKWGIPTKDAKKKYLEVTSRACQYLINDYLKRHKYTLVVDTNSATPKLKVAKARV